GALVRWWGRAWVWGGGRWGGWAEQAESGVPLGVLRGIGGPVGDSRVPAKPCRSIPLGGGGGIGGPMVDNQVPAKPCRSPPLGGGRGIGGPMVDTHLGPKSFRKLTWREGTKNKLSSRFCFVRVKVAEDDGVTIAEHEPLWLIAEWPDGGKAPTKFFRTTLARRMGKKQIVRQERWRTERMYEDLKG